MTLRFGLLGAGRIGKVHAKAVTANPKAKLVAVADAMAPAAQAIADQYGCDVRTIAQILAASDIDAVVICTPTDTHADLIEQINRNVDRFAEELLASDLAGLYTHCDVSRTRKLLDVEVDAGERALDRTLDLFQQCEKYLIDQDLDGSGANMSTAWDRMITRPGLSTERRLRELADLIEKTCLI